jgi:serine O-acetyltransferase
MGVVIGETAIVGGYAMLYQRGTLGGTGKQTVKRYPKLAKNVVVGAGAVLGNIPIGVSEAPPKEARVRIGAGSVVLQNIPANSTVVGIPGHIVRHQGKPVAGFNHESLPYLEAEVIQALFDRIQFLEQEIRASENSKGFSYCVKMSKIAGK